MTCGCEHGDKCTTVKRCAHEQAIAEKDARIAELEQERDALRAAVGRFLTHTDDRVRYVSWQAVLDLSAALHKEPAK